MRQIKKEYVNSLNGLIWRTAIVLSKTEKVKDRYNLLTSIKEFNNILYRLEKK